MTDANLPNPDVAQWVQLQERLARRGERRLVLLTGDRALSVEWLRTLLPALQVDEGVWVGDPDTSPDTRLNEISSNKTHTWLGRELSVVVWDGWQGNPPDAFAALSGALRAGGLMFWMMPPLSQWRKFQDPDYHRTGLDSAQDHPFAGRMADIVASSPGVIRISPVDGGDCPLLSEPGCDFEVGPTEDQRRAVDQLVRFGTGRRRRPLVITADRGRGKSAALGLAAAELLRRGRQHILVTSPEQDNVQTLFRHARESLGGGLASVAGNRLETATGAILEYLPVREMLARKPAAEVVLVDEAAAIPSALLKQILLGWPRVAFVSTVHGYEGAGRGFSIRFRQVLDLETPQWRALSMDQPIRWVQGDPLEQVISSLFLLGSDSASDSMSDLAAGPDTSCDSTKLVIEPWSPSVSGEDDLSQAFGLLVDAHYRTTPADLRQWLDDPAARSWRARLGHRTVGLLWGAIEGGLEPDLARQVLLGRRRVRGHLLPQSLASHSGFPEAASQRCLRVVRIAVADDVRRQSIGKRLVTAASEHLAAEGLDSVGTSFGGSSDLLVFWRQCGLRLVRVGLQQEASSGEYPVQMMAGKTAPGGQLVERLQVRLAEHWLTLAPLAWPAMEPVLLGELTSALPATAVLSEDDTRDAESFGEGHRGFLLSLPVLKKLCLVPGAMEQVLDHQDAALWCASVLLQWDWAALQHAGLCTGQRDGEDRLRRLSCKMRENALEL
ncbi:tRNA(Met) cytidine acetyltransferase [Marinobacter salinexigens]|uniref:tRNA(Met) cytidine acetyltransferase TmcA n=1 Tax=Marinobacter salinexigens TaxID=2919747 RepID=A0A5B0VBN7_9GAMM|nr:GNAT family N-acetyltransferase [Marinobacter salinexigens]KAA1171439.1 tRNA(Met) cytidine acetyltransferase [Marinobacter salinexigens]